jgi:hypothetical protein
VGKQVFVEDSRGTGCLMLRAHPEDMVLAAQKHAATEAIEAAAAEACDGIGWVVGRAFGLVVGQSMHG